MLLFAFRNISLTGQDLGSILCESQGINPMPLSNIQATKDPTHQTTFRPTITELWALYMEAIERHEWSLADSISCTIKHLEAAEIRAVKNVTLPC